MSFSLYRYINIARSLHCDATAHSAIQWNGAFIFDLWVYLFVCDGNGDVSTSFPLFFLLYGFEYNLIEWAAYGINDWYSAGLLMMNGIG